MNILLVNKYFYLKGGAEHVFFRMRDLLKSKGHKVIDFSMQSEKNLESAYTKYFVSERDYFSPNLKFKDKLYYAKELIYSKEAYDKMELLLKNEKIDIVHLHNFYHQLSSSFLPLLKKYNIPVLMTVHDYKLLCPNYSFLSHGEICEKCKGGKYYNVILNKCHKNSYLSSALLAMEAYWNKIFKYYENIDLLLCPSEFIASKFQEYNFPVPSKVLKNFINLDEYQVSKKLDDYILYFGRLSSEKSVDTIIKAMQYLKSYKIKLKIVGSGKEKGNLLQLTKNLDLENQIEIIDYLEHDELKNIIASARLVILPSISYENSPLTVLEAFAMGKVVLASRNGALVEMIETNHKDLYRGKLFNLRDHLDLKDKIKELYFDKSQLLLMGENARKYVEIEHSQEKFYNQLIKIYKSYINS